MQPDGRSISNPRKTTRQRLRRLKWPLVVVCVLGAGYVALTRSFIARAIVMSQLASATGAEASCDSVTLSLAGHAEIRGLVLRAPGVPGTAGRFVEIKKVRADAEVWSIVRGAPKVISVELDAPRVRISQSLADGAVNLAALRSSGGGGAGSSGVKGAPTTLPRITIASGVIELGEHGVKESADGYRALKQIDVAGLVEQSSGTAGESTIAFRQVDGAGNATGLLDVRGKVSPLGISLTVGDLDFSKVDPASLPTPFREGVSRLSLRGKVTGTEFNYGFDGQFSASANLADVGLTLPVEARPAEDESGRALPMEAGFEDRRLRVQGIGGRVTLAGGVWSGTLTGNAEELPCDLSFEWKGVGADSPFSIRLAIKPFEMSRKPDLLRFAPPVAQLRFAQFGDPTGLMSGEISLSRAGATATGPAALTTSGYIDIVNGSAAFHRFPYRFNGLKGRVTFDDEKIVIVDLNGAAPNGATIHAEGELIPPTNPVAEIRVTVKGLATDAALSEAMRTRGRIMEELFSRRKYEELLSAGLVRRPGGAGDAPEFEPGGVADLTVVVTRKPLADGEGDWHDTVTVHFPRVGVLPDAFPYPMIGTDVTLVKEDFNATISGGSYTGLAGGRAEISATADLERVDDPNAEFVPEVTVRAAGLPIDELLTRAIPPGREALGDGRTIPAVVRSFGLSGTLGGDIKVGMSAAGETLYDVRLAMRDIDAQPDFGGTDGAMLGDVTGTLVVDQLHLETKFRADVLKTSSREGVFPRTPAGGMELAARFDFTRPDAQSKLDIIFDATRLDLTSPLEGFVRLVSPEAAAEIASARADHAPEGTSDLHVQVRREGGGPVTLHAGAAGAEARFGLLGARVGVASMLGRASLVRENGGPARYEFDGFEGELSTVAEGVASPAGRWKLEGPLSLEGTSAGELIIGAEHARFESPLLLAVCDSASPRTSALIRGFAPVGEFDADISVNGKAAKGKLRPRTLAATVSGGRADFRSATGEIAFADDAAELNALKLESDGWGVGLSGRVESGADGSTVRDLTLDLRADSLKPDLRACLPEALRATLADLKAEVEGPIEISGAELKWTTRADGVDSISTRQRVNLQKAKADVGAELTEFDGGFDVTFSKDGAGAAIFDIGATARGAHVAGLRITDGRARIMSGESSGRPGALLVTDLTAHAHGGRVSGGASLGAPDAAQRRRFEAEFQLADLRFASVIDDYRALAGDAPAPADQADGARGLLDANFTLSGNAGDISSRRGRGTITVGGGTVLSMPLLVALVRVSNLQLPIGERMNYAAVDFFVEGATVNVEQFAVESASVGLYGFGTATWPDLALDMRFRSRSRAQIPIVSPLLERVRGEAVTGVIQGTAAKPDVSVTTLVGTKRFIGRLLGRDPTEQEKKLEQIEKMREDADMRERDRDAPLESR